jgi:hypothetical protein
MIAVFLLLWAALHFAGLVWLDYRKLQEALLELPVLAALRKEVFDFLFRTAWPALLALVIALLLRKALWDAGRLTAAAWLPEAPDFLKAPAIRSGWLDFRSPNTPRLIGQRWEDLGAATAELRAVAGRFPDDCEIQLTLAQGAVNAVNGYGRGQRWDELAAAYGELRAVAQHFTDDRRDTAYAGARGAGSRTRRTGPFAGPGGSGLPRSPTCPQPAR